MSGLLSLIVALVIIGLLLFLVNLIPMDATIKKIIHVVVIVFVALWLISALFAGVHLPTLRVE